MNTIRFIRIADKIIAVDKIAYAQDFSTSTNFHVEIGLTVQEGRIDQGDYGYEGTISHKKIDLRGKQAQAFIDWSNAETAVLLPYELPRYDEDPFLPDFPDE